MVAQKLLKVTFEQCICFVLFLLCLLQHGCSVCRHMFQAPALAYELLRSLAVLWFMMYQ